MASGNGKPKPRRELDDVRMGWHPILWSSLARNTGQIYNSAGGQKTARGGSHVFAAVNPRSGSRIGNVLRCRKAVGSAMSGARGRIIRRRTSGSSRLSKHMAHPFARKRIQPRDRSGHDGDTRPGPFKTPGVERRFSNGASGTAFDCQAISSHPLANTRCGPMLRRPPSLDPAMDVPGRTRLPRDCDGPASSALFAHRPSRRVAFGH